MDAIPNYLAHIESLLADPQSVARADAGAGQKVVGYIGDEVPVALILAAGALPLKLRGKARRATPRADQIMESAFSPSLRVIAEEWLEGGLDFLDAVVFPRSDDSSQRLYYYLCELQRRGRSGGPRPLLYDIARIPRPASIDHHRDSTRRLAEELGANIGSLRAALERVSRRTALIAEIQSRRRAASPLPGVLAWRLEHAAGSDWRESFDDATREWVIGSPTLANPRRIVLAGDVHADDSLHQAIERAGGSVVLEMTASLPGNEPEAPETLDALADGIQMQRSPVLAMRDDPQWVANAARDVNADAVVLWLVEEDEAMPWEIARQMRSLLEIGMPTLLLTRQPWIADDAARQQVTAFVTALEGQP